MVRFDRLRSSRTAFYDIRVQRALRQESKVIELPGLFFEHANEFGTDDFTFLLWILYASQFAEETLLRIDFDNFHIEFADKRLHNAFGFTLTQQTMVNEHTCQLIADRFMKQNRNNGRIYAAAKCAQYFFVANFLHESL